MFIQVLAISPLDPKTVYSGSVNLWKSTNEGRRWRFLTNWKGEAGAEDVHVDHHELAILPGSEWIEIYNPYFADIITDISYHPRNLQVVWLTQGGYGDWHGGARETMHSTRKRYSVQRMEDNTGKTSQVFPCLEFGCQSRQCRKRYCGLPPVQNTGGPSRTYRRIRSRYADVQLSHKNHRYGIL